ncbi:MAG: sulfatase [Planctomycetes bacterium]|nr:sulfatase [Planctomycetota bacterium]
MKNSKSFNCTLAIIIYMLGSWLHASEKPNIVWIFSDDHAYQAIGAYGGRFENENLTPNIDSLAKNGMTFDRAYVANSICAPSRATLLTGKHSHLNGQVNNGRGFSHDQPQFQKVLRKHGYQTAMIGKIHLDGNMQGFDYWEVLPGQGRYNNPIFVTEEGKTTYEGHSTDIITDRALNWLKNDTKSEKPFMLMVHYKAPHRNWEPAPRMKEAFKNRTFPEPDSLFDDYKGRGTAANKQDMSIEKTMSLGRDLKLAVDKERKEFLDKNKLEGKALVRWKYQAYMRDYLACIAGVDENIGRLLKYLKEQGLDKNTVVMYSADQGFYLGEHGWFDKRFMYEESFRTPFLAKWPGVIKPGTRNNDLVQNIDFAETFLDIAGAPIPGDMQGVSLLPLLKSEKPTDWRKSLYYHYYEYPAVHSVRRHEGVFDKRYKLIRFYGLDVPNGEEWEFFDLEKDPHEMSSTYNNPENANIIKTLKAELARLREYYQVKEIPQHPRKKKGAKGKRKGKKNK